MSAFICQPDHFKALALFAVSRRNGSMNVDPRYLTHDGGSQEIANGSFAGTLSNAEIASYYADILFQENVRSVKARYPDHAANGLPGPCEIPQRLVVTSRDVAQVSKLRAVDILKMCDCLEYQSCETETYRFTLAFKLLDRIRRAAIHCLPGYDDAPWDYDRAEYEGKRRAA